MLRRESRARRNAQKLGLAVRKGRYRLPELRDAYGGYMLVDAERNVAVSGAHPSWFSLSLDELENELKERAQVGLNHRTRRTSVCCWWAPCRPSALGRSIQGRSTELHRIHAWQARRKPHQPSACRPPFRSILASVNAVGDTPNLLVNCPRVAGAHPTLNFVVEPSV